MFNDYYDIVRKLIDCFQSKINELSSGQSLIIAPNTRELCDDLELALCYDISDRNDNTNIGRKIKHCVALIDLVNTCVNIVLLLEKILTPYKIRFLCHKIGSNTTVIFEDSDNKPTQSLENTQLILSEEVPVEQPCEQTDIDKLILCGYTQKEIDSYLQLGANSLFIKKLADNKLVMSKEQSIACMKNCISMGDANAVLAKRQHLLIFLGNTGAGKSTAINYLHGCTLVKESGRVVVSSTSLHSEIAQIGHASLSKTLIPQMIISKNAGVAFCDCPGFIDDRGPEINIANGVNIKRMVNAAASFKIVLLISYGSIFKDRGNEIIELKKTLVHLLGNIENIKALSKSILIGITKVPTNVDGDVVTIQSLREKLFGFGQLPHELKAQTHILDSLDRRQADYALSREEWLICIEKLEPVKASSQIFNAALNTSDELFLIDIGKYISDKIKHGFESENYQIALHYLSILASLRKIKHQVIEEYFRENLINLSASIAIQEQSILELSNQGHFKVAEQKLCNIQAFLSILQAEFPEFKRQKYNINEYIYNKRLEKDLTEIFSLLDDLKNNYYQSNDDILLLSRAMLEVVQISQDILKTNSLHFVSTVLSYLQKLPKIDELACKLLQKIQVFIKKYPDFENMKQFKSCIESCANELEDILANAKKVFQDYLYDKKTVLKLYISASTSAIPEYIGANVNRIELLERFKGLADDSEYEDLKKVLNEISKEINVIANCKLLILSLSQLYKICMINDDKAGIDSQVNFIRIQLLNIKDKIESEQKKQEMEKAAEEAKRIELQEQLKLEKEKLQSQSSKLHEMESLIKCQQDELAKQAEQEKQAELLAKELLRKNEELAQKELERDKALQQEEQEKILAKVKRNLNNVIADDVKKRRSEQQQKIEQKRTEVFNKQKKFLELPQKKSKFLKQCYQKYQVSLPQFLQTQPAPDYINENPKLSDEEIREVARREVEKEKAEADSMLRSPAEDSIKQLQDKLNEVELLRKSNNLTKDEIIKQFQGLENSALQLRYSQFFLTRGDFNCGLAIKEADSQLKEAYYRNALKDYKRALYYDSSLDSIAEYITKIESFLCKKSLENSYKQTFFASIQADSNSTSDISKREELTKEEMEELEKFKMELRKIARLNNK